MVEHRTPNPAVGGSSPSWPATSFFPPPDPRVWAKGEGRSVETAGGGKEDGEKMAARVFDWFRQGRSFLSDVQGEAKRVTWLGLKHTAAQTAMTLVFVFIIAIYLGLVDLGLSRLINYFLNLGL